MRFSFHARCHCLILYEWYLIQSMLKEFSFHTRYCLILYKGYSEGFNLIDVERIFNHTYFNFVKYLNEIYLKVCLTGCNGNNGKFGK